MTFLFKKVLEKYTSFSADEGTNRDNFSVLSCLEDFVLQVFTQRPKKKSHHDVQAAIFFLYFSVILLSLW